MNPLAPPVKVIWGQCVEAVIPIDAHGQRVTNAFVLKRLEVSVETHAPLGQPRVRLELDVVAHLLLEILDLRRRHAAHLEHDLTADHRRGDILDPVTDGSVEIDVIEMVVLVAHGLPFLAGHVLDELERAGAVDVLGVPVTLLGDVLGRVNGIVGQREIGWIEGVRLVHVEHDRVIVRRLDRFDAGEQRLPRRDDAFRRITQAVVAGLDVLRRQRRPVVELDALANLEGVLHVVVGYFPAFRDIAFQRGQLSRSKFSKSE